MAEHSAEFGYGVAPGHGRSNFASRIVEFLLYSALVLAPGFLGGLAFFFVARAFFDGAATGMRSFAAAVLPLMVLTFMVAPKIGRDQRTVRVPNLPMWAEIAGMASVGIASMLLLELSTTIPVVELVLSAGFAFILYLWLGGKDRAAPYCLGLVVGALGYVIVLGVPHA
jgi:hypothetical protein